MKNSEKFTTRFKTQNFVWPNLHVRSLTANIKENRRNRKKTKRGRKRLYDEEIFEERFHTVERVFAWEDKFKRLLLRFERISLHHFGFKLLAYTMINLRHFCG